MTEQAFASVWGLSYSDFEFLSRYGAKSQVMLAYQLLYLRRHGRFPEGRSELDPDVIECIADQIGVADDLAYSFSSDTARRQRGDRRRPATLHGYGNPETLCRQPWPKRSRLCLLSPLIYLHINPYGRFEVDLDKRIDFDLLAA